MTVDEKALREAVDRAARTARSHSHHALWAGLPTDSLERFGIALAQRIESAIRSNAYEVAKAPAPKPAPSPAAVQGSGVDGKRIACRVLQRILDFDDRTSPEDQPDMLLVTGQELTDLIEEEIGEAFLSPAPTDYATARLLTAARAAKRYLEPDLVEPGRTVFWGLVSAIKDMEGSNAK